MITLPLFLISAILEALAAPVESIIFTSPDDSTIGDNEPFDSKLEFFNSITLFSFKVLTTGDDLTLVLAFK